jgi:predicted transglutaminase-like cysteine proteinase
MTQKLLFVVLLLCTTSLFAGKYSLPQSAIDAFEAKYGQKAGLRASALINLMNELADKSTKEKVVKVNDFFNNVLYDSDPNVWGQPDYWATRMEFLGKAAGDCEDYSIAKYFTLKQLGIEEDKMYMTYAKSLKYNVAHMVVTFFVKPNTTPLVLDNYNKQILPATKRPDLVPIYSFNGQKLYDAKQQGLGKEVPGGAEKNKKWSKLIDDIKMDGL